MDNTLDTNSNISHYSIVSKIGAGGMGEVYLAEDPQFERPVRLKILGSKNSGQQKEKTYARRKNFGTVD
jgi:serine/threonine protein kinase